MPPVDPTEVDLVFRGRKVVRDRALIMAIINRTTDSFFDQGATFGEEEAQNAISRAVAAGADVIDIGGVRAEAGPEVSTGEEIDRVAPVVQWARETYPDLFISVDTWRREVGEEVCRVGADIINDSWAAAEPELMDVAAKYGTGYICTHTGGQAPRTVPVRPRYEDVVATVVEETVRLAELAAAKGVPRGGILIDPTLGILYGKDTDYNVTLLRHVRAFVDTGWPVLMAISNKDFIGEILDADLEDRMVGTLAATAYAANAGAVMFRAHHVRETRQVAEMIATINGSRPPSRPYQWTA
ncbi:dihydropteroate synthase [Amycolatopsis nigrescens]|uniref:dihydropteroate synthase n=1 Tax=Amycolatopsis nigrescens TaxID=381445 RepID=UPI00035C0CE0|nr:dihydropteroate synthase [Amycolatopsis nigrescens]